MSALILPPALGARVISREPYWDWRTDESVSGKEARSSWWLSPRTRYKVAFEVLRQDAGSRLDYQQVASFFARHFGGLDSFLFTDEADSSVTDHCFGLGDGSTTAFQLQRTLAGAVYDAYGGPWASPTQSPYLNLITQSEDVSHAWWTTKNSTTVSANETTAPDGALTADKLVEVAATAQHYVTSPSFTQISGLTYSYSVFAKQGGRTQLALVSSQSGTPGAAFDLAAGTVLGTQMGGTGTIASVGNGWFRCTLTWAANATFLASAFVYNLISTDGMPATAYAGDAAKGLYLWGAACAVTATAPRYVATTTAAAVASPWPSYTDGFEPVWDPAPGATLYKDGDGLGRRTLSPWSRTNSLLRSQGDGATGWSKGLAGDTFAYGVAGAPDGTATAMQLTEGVTVGSHSVYNSNWTSPGPGLWTGEIFFKRLAGTRNFSIRVQSASALHRSPIFDGATGAVLATPYPTETIESGCVACGNGWLRAWATVQHASGASYAPLLALFPTNNLVEGNYTGDGTSAFLFWGGQVETGALPGGGDYIPTVAATVSRTDYTQSATGGLTLAVAPASGAVLSWTGSYYKRVRLAGEGLQLERLASGMWATTVDLVSVKP